MSTTNENILQSLAILEQNLKNINSAKEQVNNVVTTTGNLAKIIEKYQASFESLSINVKAVLDDSRKFNLDSIAKLSEQTKNLSKETAKLSEFDTSKALKSIEGEAIKQFQKKLSKPIEGLEEQIKNIEKEVTKLTEYNFKDSFSNLEKQVINQFNKDLKEKLTNLDNKVIDLQLKINEFKAQILRIERIDLESHFKHMLSTLTNHTDKQNIEITKKHEEIRDKCDNIILRLARQEKEINTLKTLLFSAIGMLIIGIILNIFF